MRFGLTMSVLAILTLTASGCASMMPNWSRPGTLTDQRNRAVVHDPYANNRLGPPVDGVRPRDFAKPLAEPEQAALHDNLFGTN